MDVIVVCCIAAAAAAAAYAARSSTPTFPDRDFQFSLVPPRNLNGLSIAELAAIRQDGFERVREFHGLIPVNYRFHERPVWTKIKEPASWLSVLSLMHNDYSLTDMSDQISAESYTLSNPFLPASLTYRAIGPNGLILDCLEVEKLWLKSHYPKSANYDSESKTIDLVYRHPGYQREYRAPHSCSGGLICDTPKETNGPGFFLNLLNARDLGFEAFESTFGIVLASACSRR